MIRDKTNVILITFFIKILKSKPDFFPSYRVSRNKYSIYPGTCASFSYLFQIHHLYSRARLVLSSRIRNQYKLHDNFRSETFHHLYDGNQLPTVYDFLIFYLKYLNDLLFLLKVRISVHVRYNIHVCSDFFRNIKAGKLDRSLLLQKTFIHIITVLH